MQPLNWVWFGRHCKSTMLIVSYNFWLKWYEAPVVRCELVRTTPQTDIIRQCFIANTKQYYRYETIYMYCLIVRASFLLCISSSFIFWHYLFIYIYHICSVFVFRLSWVVLFYFFFISLRLQRVCEVFFQCFFQ